MYILARSGSSIKDQILYVPTRIEDLVDLDERITVNNQEYTDVLRFFSGDTPARQLESGQQCGGELTKNNNLYKMTHWLQYTSYKLSSMITTACKLNQLISKAIFMLPYRNLARVARHSPHSIT